MSSQIDLRLEGDGAIPEMIGKRVLHAGNDAAPIIIAALSEGMTSGRTSVCMAFDLGQFEGPPGDFLFVETSLRFLAAADALRARYPNG